MKRLSGMILLLLATACAAEIETIIETRTQPGLKSAVEIYRDTWGINHIYADNTMICFLHKVMQRPKIGCFNLKFGDGKLPVL